MKLPSRYITVVGLLVAVGAIFLDPATTPFLTTLLGEAAATKLAAFGALVASIGRALIPPSETPAPSDK